LYYKLMRIYMKCSGEIGNTFSILVYHRANWISFFTG
jgi:hypothetical protein